MVDMTLLAAIPNKTIISWGILWYSHDAVVLVPSDNLGDVECAVSERCRLLLSRHCSHIGQLLCQLGEVSSRRTVAHRMDQQHLVKGSGVVDEIDVFSCPYGKITHKTERKSTHILPEIHRQRMWVVPCSCLSNLSGQMFALNESETVSFITQSTHILCRKKLTFNTLSPLTSLQSYFGSEHFETTDIFCALFSQVTATALDVTQTTEEK